MDLVRLILLKIEEFPGYGAPIELLIEGREDQEIDYHLKLMNEAGLITALRTSGFGAAEEWIALGMTWSGHEFLDAAREDSRWKQAKDLVKAKGSGMMFEVLKSVLVELAKGGIAPLIRQSIQSL